MATCYPPLTIDVTTLDFNGDGGGFYGNYITPDPSCEPPACVLPDLIPTNLALSDTTLTTPQGGCKYTFNNVFPQPPIYIPKPAIPYIQCPQGMEIETAITIVGSGSATTTGGITTTVSDGGCNVLIGGIIDINVPPVPCPGGMSFSSNVTVGGTTSSMNVSGGPCNFALIGSMAGGLGGGDYNDCSDNNPDMTVSDLFTTDPDTGNPVLNLPSVCTSCDSTTQSPYTITDPTFNTIEASYISNCTCCANDYDNDLDLCEGILSLSNGSNTAGVSAEGAFLNVSTGAGTETNITPTVITITNASGATVTIDSGATAGNSISFVEVQVCVGGTTKHMYVLGSAVF